MAAEQTKVLAYVMRYDRLLVFRQPAHPEAGVQVPGGTVENGESPEEALRREVTEETGLSRFRIVNKIGESEFDARKIGKAERHRRHYYQVSVEQPVSAGWRHDEYFSGEDEPIEFEFFWLPPAEAERVLVADQNEFLFCLSR